MKRSERPYPRWWVEAAQARRSQLDAALTELRARFAADPAVVRALVFGSYARGTVAPKSDLDVIVIEESDVPQIARTERYYAAPSVGVAVDYVVYTPSEFARLSCERSFVIQAVAEGTWFYARASA